MSYSILKGKTVDARLWLPIEEVESQALDQLRNIASLPWVAHVAAMPDTHFGKGATVGSVIAMRGAVAPAAVGVDIGCGMAALKTNLDADKVQRKIKHVFGAVSDAIPVGFDGHDSDVLKKVSNDELRRNAKTHMTELTKVVAPVNDYANRSWNQLGTLGGGNHFIELCLDEDLNVWLMLHSGSRGVGKTIAEYHMAIAKKLGHNVGLPDKDLAVFLSQTQEMADYRRDLYWAQDYAFYNRAVMLDLYVSTLREFWPSLATEAAIFCHHNYVAEEMHFGEKLFVTRKGAIEAGVEQYGIIPGSMGTKSYIVKGLGNADALCSASHGAGRKMSRGKAKQKFTLDDLEKQTNGVMCRKDQGVLDEIPGAYKDIDRVMENQTDLVQVVATLKQIMCVKG